MLTIRNNISSLSAQRNLNNTLTSYQKSMERLSSGYRINRAADDAAGLSISEKMRMQIRGLKQASSNASNGIELTKTADSALEQTHSMLQRISELAILAQDGTMSDADKEASQAEADSLIEEITRIATATEYNGKKLLDGNLDINFMVGYTNAASNKINFKVDTAMDADGLGIDGVDITTSDGLKAIQDAIATVSSTRSTIGATQNRLEYTVKNLDTIRENTVSAESRIRDVDTAEEESNATAMQLLYNAGISVLSMANQNQQSILNLLG